MSRLAIYLFGSFRVTLDGRPVRAFRSDKTRLLLAYLAVEARQLHRRESLVGLFWPEYSEEAALRNLRQVLYRLRKAIVDDGNGIPHLLVTTKEIQINPESELFLDVSEFDALIHTYQAHHPGGSLPCSPCVAALQTAVDLYQGEFLAGFDLPDSPAFEHWKLVWQEYCHWLALEALARLVDYYESVQDHEQVIRWTLQKLKLNPWSKRARRRRMKALVLSGRRDLALKEFSICEQVLWRELGVKPEMETTHLYEQIRDQSLEMMGQEWEATDKNRAILSYARTLEELLSSAHRCQETGSDYKGEAHWGKEITGITREEKRAFLLLEAQKLIDQYLADE
jgi:DNA-binding SARP family transcriptional activator